MSIRKNWEWEGYSMGRELKDAEASFGFGPQDGNHVRVWKDRAEAQVWNFSGTSSPYFWRSALKDFRDALASLHRTLHGTAEFKDMEGAVALNLSVNRLGQIDLEGELQDYGRGDQPARMTFTIQIDQSYLPQVIAELDEWLAREARS